MTDNVEMMNLENKNEK